MKKFKRHRAPGLFDQDLRLSKPSKLGDPLERLSQGIDFEMFREKLQQALEPKTRQGNGGRPPYDYVLMFKILTRIIHLPIYQSRFRGFSFCVGA